MTELGVPESKIENYTTAAEETDSYTPRSCSSGYIIVEGFLAFRGATLRPDARSQFNELQGPNAYNYFFWIQAACGLARRRDSYGCPPAPDRTRRSSQGVAGVVSLPADSY